MLWFFVGLAILGIPFLIIILTGGGFRFPWISFYVKGKESGFAFREVHLLRRAVLQAKLQNPTSLFWSEKALDRCIRAILIKQRQSGTDGQPENVDFVGKLFEFRRRVEFNLPKYRLGLTSTRSIGAGQILKIAVPGGLFHCRVIENLRKYLAVSYPEGRKFEAAVNWRNQRVKVYFWRQDDAGYYFETKILGDYSEKQVPILHILHSDGLMRTQKRGTIRVGLRQAGTIYPLRSEADANESWIAGGGYKCKMVDISESGAGLLVGGKGKAGMFIKLQTVLNDEQIVMCGTVRSVSFNEKQNTTILHLEAISPSQAMRNRILSYVYGIFGNAEGETKEAGMPRSEEPAPAGIAPSADEETQGSKQSE